MVLVEFLTNITTRPDDTPAFCQPARGFYDLGEAPPIKTMPHRLDSFPNLSTIILFNQITGRWETANVLELDYPIPVNA